LDNHVIITVVDSEKIGSLLWFATLQRARPIAHRRFITVSAAGPQKSAGAPGGSQDIDPSAS
jgi:hypothetical protein